MIDDGLDNYNNYYKCKFDGNCCQEETINLVIIRNCGILIIYWRVEYVVDVSLVIESDFICAKCIELWFLGRINILSHGLMNCLIYFKELDVFLRLIRDLGIGSWGFEVECIQDGISDEICTSNFERASIVCQVFEMWIQNFDWIK